MNSFSSFPWISKLLISWSAYITCN